MTTLAARAHALTSVIDLCDGRWLARRPATAEQNAGFHDALAHARHKAAHIGSDAMAVVRCYRIELKYLAIAAAIAAGFVSLQGVGAFEDLNAVVDLGLALLAKAGFVGIFVISIIANASLVVHIPYTVPVVSLALSGAGLESMVWAGVWAGLGCGIGEILSYLAARKLLGSNPHLTASSLFRRVNQVVTSHPRLIPAVVFFMAVSPLPDDVVIIPLAMARYSLRSMLLPLFVGKVLHTVTVACLIHMLVESWAPAAMSSGVKADFAVGLLAVFVLGVLYQVDKARVAGHPSHPEPA